MRIWLLMAVTTLAGCETIKPYEKEFLLSPLMDDAGVAQVSASMMTSASSGFEKLAAGAAGTGGTSCPTCGG
jgi:hypothetical protein